MPTRLLLNCLIEGEGIVFTVIAAGDDNVSALKKLIQSERASDSLKDVGPHTLELWKLKDSNSIAAEPHYSLIDRIGVLEHDLSTFADNLGPTKRLSKIFPTQPCEDDIQIIVKRPLTSSSSQDSNLFQDSPPNWLTEIHKKLWRKTHLFGEIFRTANLTTADFVELQVELERINPSRSEPSYKTQDVMKVKADFLRGKNRDAILDFKDAPNRKLVPSAPLVAPSSAMDLDATAHHGDCHDTAEPSVISNVSVPPAYTSSASKAHPGSPSPVLDDTMDVDADAEPQFANFPAYIIADANELSTGSTAVLPCTIRYVDLTILELKELIPMMHLTLIRDEWNAMIKLFNGRKRGVRGSAIFTGSPGIGKTCLLYYILILCLIKGQPVVFQDTRGDVYLIGDEVRSQAKDITVAGDDVLTLIDAGGQTCQPSKYIFRNSNLRILLTSFPRSSKDGKWLRHDVGDEWAVYVMKPWSQNEWLIASLFIADKDITLSRFWKTFKICGSMPRQFLLAAESRKTRKCVQSQIWDAIARSQDIRGAIDGVVGDEVVPHRAFVVHPSKEARFLSVCHVEAISTSATKAIIRELNKQSTDAAFNLYQSLRWSSKAGSFWGNLWELKAHEYLPHRGGFSFTIRSLDDAPNTQLHLPADILYSVFGPPQEMSGTIADCVETGKAVYLQPISENFASLDSILYRPNHSLIGIQVTNAKTHSIHTKGLKLLQSYLSPQNQLLSPLRPTSEKPWIILFVVPQPMAAAFTKQEIKGEASDAWRKKTVQYVLGLDEHEVFRAQFDDEELDDEAQSEDEESDDE